MEKGCNKDTGYSFFYLIKDNNRLNTSHYTMILNLSFRTYSLQSTKKFTKATNLKNKVVHLVLLTSIKIMYDINNNNSQYTITD